MTYVFLRAATSLLTTKVLGPPLDGHPDGRALVCVRSDGRAQAVAVVACVAGAGIAGATFQPDVDWDDRTAAGERLRVDQGFRAPLQRPRPATRVRGASILSRQMTLA